MYRSDSAIASPHVGKETHAIEFLRSADCLSPVIRLIAFQKLFDFFLLLARDIADNEVLVRCQAEITGMNFCDFPQSGHELIIIPIANPAVLDKQGEMPSAIAPFTQP